MSSTTTSLAAPAVTQHRTKVQAIRLAAASDLNIEKSPLSAAATARSPLALSPAVVIRGSPRSPRHEDRRPRSASSAPCYRKHHHRSPPRSPHDVELLYGSALGRVGHDTAGIADDIISKQSEILARKHDIAVWQRKIHAAERLISGLEGQVDVLVKEAREKQHMEKELTCQRDALLTTGGLSEKEFNALGVILGNLDLSKSPNATI